MSHTPEQRSARPLCNARKKNGEPCRNFAGQATDHPGFGVCRFHGGMLPKQKKYAALLEAKVNAAAKLEYHLQPVEALLWMVHVSAGQVRHLGGELAELDGRLNTTEVLVAQRLWNEERDRLARFSKMALDAGVAERAVKVAEQVGAAVAEVLRNVLYDPQLALTKKQQGELPTLIRRHLTAQERHPDVVVIRNGAGEDE